MYFGDFFGANFCHCGADFCVARCCVVFLWLLFRVAALLDEVVLMIGIVLSEHTVVVNKFKH